MVALQPTPTVVVCLLSVFHHISLFWHSATSGFLESTSPHPVDYGWEKRGEQGRKRLPTFAWCQKVGDPWYVVSLREFLLLTAPSGLPRVGVERLRPRTNGQPLFGGERGGKVRFARSDRPVW